MAEEEQIVCIVCGASNPKGADLCEQCGVKLEPAKEVKGEEIDKLLEELAEAEVPPEEEKEALDIDKEIVDELLDSLLIEEEEKAEEFPIKEFECPLCSAVLPIHAKTCTMCGAQFVEAAEKPEVVEEVVVEEKPVITPPEVKPAVEVPVKVEVIEEDISKLRVSSGRLIDFVVVGTIGGLLAVFFFFRMYSWNALSQNPLSAGILSLVAIVGMAAGFILFQLSTSAISQGDRLVKDGYYQEAIERYNRAIRMGYKPASAWTSKGVAHKRMEKYEEALRCHNIAIKLNPKNEIAWCNKGDIYFKLGRFEDAIKCYDKALEIRPKYAIAWNNKGATLAKLGRFEEAKECHDKAVRLKPKYTAAWLNRGEVLARLGDRVGAEKCLARAKTLGA